MASASLVQSSQCILDYVSIMLASHKPQPPWLLLNVCNSHQPSVTGHMCALTRLFIPIAEDYNIRVQPNENSSLWMSHTHTQLAIISSHPPLCPSMLCHMPNPPRLNDKEAAESKARKLEAENSSLMQRLLDLQVGVHLGHDFMCTCQRHKRTH